MIISCPTCVENLAEHYARRLFDRAIIEVGYFCCFNTYVTKFEKEKEKLIAEQKELQKDIRDAGEKGETLVEDGVEQWMAEANAVVKEDTETETRQKCFSGLCPNCIWQYQRGSELESKRQDIIHLIKRRSEFTRVARPPPKNPGIKYYAPPNFIEFNSRKSTFKELVEALVSGNSNVIGLQGLGGMGKTTLAQQVGLHVYQSGKFQEVTFTTVSNPPDTEEIRRHIAEQLNFPSEGGKESHSKALWSRIASGNGKVLIILDDIWNTLELTRIGIPHNHQNCCVLITTRDSEVCKEMGCQPTIPLNSLKDRDGLDVFKKLGTRSEDSTRQFMDLAQDIVKVCGGLPLAIVPMANTLKDRHQREWKKVLNNLHNSEPQDNDDKNWIKVRSSLMLSYDKLEKKAKDLLLLCSLFPKDYEIHMEFLSKLGIGFLFGEANNYSSLRERLILAQKDLINSSLLLELKEAYVKMHDLVRKVVLSMKDKEVQVVMNSSGKLKSNLKFLYWSNNGFPNHCEGTKLEVVLLWIKGEVRVEDSYAIFKEMVQLRVLFLCCDQYVVKPTLSLQSFLSFKNIRTLILNNWILGDISILKHLKTLVTLEFESCSIMELSKEIVEIESLRLLGIRKCTIERKNPFEVIGSCSQLEELYFVSNEHAIYSKPKYEEENKYEVAHGPELQMYSVACSGLQYFAGNDNGLFKCFNTKHVENLMSEEIFKYLVEGAEILELCKMGKARWKSFVPDIIPMKDGVMKDLIKLCLYNCADIECLIEIKETLGDVDVFSHLDELHLVNVDAKDLYRGPMPSSFLSELKILKLLHCKNLYNDFLKGHLKLPHLTVLQLDYCPKFESSIFRPSVARSLMQLEELFIKDCEQVETLIKYESPVEAEADANHQNGGGSLFPKLKSLKIEGCGKIQLLLSVLLVGDLQDLQELSIRSCRKLEYIFGEYQDEGALPKKIMLPSLTTMEVEDVPSFINICKAFNKCRQRASPAQNDAHGHACCRLSSEFGASMKRNETFHPTEWPSLKHINLGLELVKRPFPHSMVCLQGDQESIKRPCPHLMGCLRGRQPNMETRVDSMKLLKDMQNLTSLGIRHSEIEEIFNLEGIKREALVELKLQVLEMQDLHNLRYIYKDPNNILNLCYLEKLVFSGCDQLTAIFTASTMKRLPRLSHLKVTQCGGLIYIIEERKEGAVESMRLPPGGASEGTNVCSLPMLQNIHVSRCNKLESLFSISTISMLQELRSLKIEEASNLKEVFGCRQDDTRERRLKDVVPELLHLKLKNLPNLENFCRVIDRQSVKRIMKFEVFDCAKWERHQGIEEPQSTYSNTGQAMPHISDVGTSSQVHSHLNIQKRTREAKGKQVIETQGQTSALPNSVENFDEATQKTGEEVPFSKTSEMLPSSSNSAPTRRLSKEETMKTQANGPTPALEKKASGISPAESEMTSTSQHTVNERIPEDTVNMKRKVIPSYIDSQDGGSKSSQSAPSKEETMKTQAAKGPTVALEKKASETSPADSKMTSTSQHSNEAMPNGRVQGDLTSKDDVVATPIDDNKALMNSLATMVTPRQTVFERIPEETVIMEGKVVPSSIYSQVGGSQSNQSTLTTRKTRYPSVQEGPRQKKATKANHPHVIPSHYQGVSGPSSQILGIGEILETMELKDGEPALLAKALELYPQLRLSREQRTRPIIAFSYRVLINILFMLATKTPSTITASDKLTLKANLDAATLFGFDKDWIKSVRTKVIGNDMFDVLATEEILVKKAKLETYSATLEQVQNQRIEAIGRHAVARRHLDLVQSELEAIDSQLYGQLEARKQLIINMMKFREIVRAKYRPFGI